MGCFYFNVKQGHIGMGALDKKIRIRKSSTFAPLTISLLLASLIFLIDIRLPLGVAGGVLYVAVILVSLWSHSYKQVVYLAFICSALTILGFYFSPPGGETWKVVTNRSLALFVIWVTAVLAIKWKAASIRNTHIEYEADKEMEKEKIYLATIHGAFHIINNLLNQLKLVKFEIKNNPDFDKKVAEMFNEMLAEANTLLSELSSVKQIDEKQIIQSVHPSKPL